MTRGAQYAGNMRRDATDRRLTGIFRDHEHSDYVTGMFSAFGRTGVWVGAGTLRPDKSYSSKHLTWFLLCNQLLCAGKEALDMGCGSGVQTLALAHGGASRVDAIDISEAAVRSTHANLVRHGMRDRVKIHHADLFGYTDGETYDVVVFNHPFFCRPPIKGMTFSYALMDEGLTLRRFFQGLSQRLRPGGFLVMPFSYICGPENDPFNHVCGASMILRRKHTVTDANGKHALYVFQGKA